MNDKYKGYLCIAVSVFCFSTMEISLKLLKSIDPLQMTFTRFIIAGVLIFPFVRRRMRSEGLHFSRKDYKMFAMLGFVGMTVAMTLFQSAIVYTPASTVAILFSSNPVFVLLFAYLLLGDPIYKRNILALALDIIGILFIINVLDMKLDPRGVALAIISALLFALYGVLGKKPTVKFGGLTTTCMNFLIGGAEMFALALLTRIPAVSSFLTKAGLSRLAEIPLFRGYSLSMLPLFLYVCVIATGIGFTCYFSAMEYVPVSIVSLVFFFKPIFAPIFALLILGDPLTITKVIGILFILGGSMCNLLPQIQKDRRAARGPEREGES